MECPRCGKTSVMEIQFRYTMAQCVDRRIGDKIEWAPRVAVQNGGRPPNGDVDASGYAECSECELDFFSLVHIRNDIIVGVDVDHSQPGYIQPDRVDPPEP